MPYVLVPVSWWFPAHLRRSSSYPHAFGDNFYKSKKELPSWVRNRSSLYPKKEEKAAINLAISATHMQVTVTQTELMRMSCFAKVKFANIILGKLFLEQAVGVVTHH